MKNEITPYNLSHNIFVLPHYLNLISLILISLEQVTNKHMQMKNNHPARIFNHPNAHATSSIKIPRTLRNNLKI